MHNEIYAFCPNFTCAAAPYTSLALVWCSRFSSMEKAFVVYGFVCRLNLVTVKSCWLKFCVYLFSCASCVLLSFTYREKKPTRSQCNWERFTLHDEFFLHFRAHIPPIRPCSFGKMVNKKPSFKYDYNHFNQHNELFWHRDELALHSLIQTEFAQNIFVSMGQQTAVDSLANQQNKRILLIQQAYVNYDKRNPDGLPLLGILMLKKRWIFSSRFVLYLDRFVWCVYWDNDDVDIWGKKSFLWNKIGSDSQKYSRILQSIISLVLLIG